MTNTADFFENPYQKLHPRIARKASKRRQRNEDREQRHSTRQDTHHRAEPLAPRNAVQADLIEALNTGDQVFTVGPAGTGKTYVVARHAIRRLLDDRTAKIVVTRVAVSKKKHRLGFRPGNQDEKIADWLVPLLDGFKAETSAKTIEALQRAGRIEYVPFETLRGRSFEDAIVICDEAQNLDFSDFKLFLTRIGERSQVIVTGDPDQCDLEGEESGLVKILDMIEDYEIPADVIEFDEDDVVRSETARLWVKAFNAEA